MLFLNKKATEESLSLTQAPSLDESALDWVGDSYRPSGETPEIEPVAGRRTCASLQCTSSWTAPWRSRKRPIFEGQWACSGRCVLELVRGAMRRESANGASTSPVQHKHRIPLGLLLLDQGWITQVQLQRALEIQRGRGGRIGELLVDECGVSAELITRGLSMQWNCPVLDASGFSPRAMALAAPRMFIKQSGLLPLRVAGGRILYAGFEDRLDASAALALEQMTGIKVESGLMKTDDYESARASLMRGEAIEVKEENFGDTDSLSARITAVLEQKQPIASKLVRFYQHYWLRLWLEPEAKGIKGNLPQSKEDMLDYVFTVERLA
jgi:hypothetical protein